MQSEETTIARKATYSYERRQRDLAKVAKQGAKREARAAKKLGDQQEGTAAPEIDGEPSAERSAEQPSAEQPAVDGA